jgi:hypothetical protein
MKRLALLLAALTTTACATGSGDDGPTMASSSDHHSETAGSGANGEACYPGASGEYQACLPIRGWSSAWGSAYKYAAHSDRNYTAPVRFVDLEAADEHLRLSPHFTVGEVMQLWKGRYAVFQMHMVEKLERIRYDLGVGVEVVSGYRSPKYNRSVDGASFSRHMYGDAIDIKSGGASLGQLKKQCQAMGADYISMYTGHVHCDWRKHPKDPAFYQASGALGSSGEPLDGASEAGEHEHTLHHVTPLHDGLLVELDGGLYADVSGFDEGEPYREWTAFDADDQVIDRFVGEHYRSPAGTARVQVEVGGQVSLDGELDADGRMLAPAE